MFETTNFITWGGAVWALCVAPNTSWDVITLKCSRVYYEHQIVDILILNNNQIYDMCCIALFERLEKCMQYCSKTMKDGQ